MQNLIFSPIAVSELVDLIAAEIQTRLINHGLQQPVAPEPKRLNGLKAAAEHYGCTPLTMAKLIRSGAVPYHRFGRKYFFLSNELDASLKVEARRFGENRRKK